MDRVNIEIEDINQIIVSDSSWLKDGTWYKRDGSLKDIISAEEIGLFEPPKTFFHLKKKFFNEIFKDKSKWGIIIVRGPRRIGKTSTIKYLIKTMIEKGYPRESFIYISLDNEKLLFILEKKKMLKEFVETIIEKFDRRPLIIVLDEVTFYKGWARAIKNLIDNGKISDGIGAVSYTHLTLPTTERV